MRRDRILGALVAVLGLGIAAALVVVGILSGDVTANRGQLHRQDTAMHQLAGAVVAAQQDASAQKRLVQALQRQVRHLGGQPLTAPPTPRPAAETPASTPGPAATPTATPRPSPTATARPSPKPTPSPSRSPSPRPSLCIPNVQCLPIGGI